MKKQPKVKVIVVFTTVAKRLDALKMSRALVRRGLTACATILPNVRSVYKWEGKLEQGSEVVIMMKTTRSRYSALERAIKSMHRYQVPEILAIPVESGYLPYLVWVKSEVVN